MTFGPIPEIKATEAEVPPAQDHELSIERLNRYVHALFRTAVLVRGAYLRVLPEINEALNIEGSRALMFEYETALPLSDQAAYQLMSDLVAAMPSVRIALIARHQIHRPSIDLGPSFARETGAQLRAFFEPAAAERWLLDE